MDANATNIRKSNNVEINNADPTIVIKKKNTKLQILWDDFLRSLTYTNCKYIIKGIIAFDIAIIIAYSPLIVSVTASYSLLPVSAGLLHPGRTLGAHIWLATYFITGVAIGLIFSSSSIAASTTYNALHLAEGDKGGRGIGLAFIAVSLVISHYLRAANGEFMIFSVFLVMSSAIPVMSHPDATVFEPRYIANIAIPLLIGLAVSLAVNFLILPETAYKNLGRDFLNCFVDLEKLINLSVTKFLMKADAEGINSSEISASLAKLRGSVNRVKAAYAAAKREIIYGHLRPEDLKSFKGLLETLTNHGSSLALTIQNENLLLAARRASRTLLTQENDNIVSAKYAPYVPFHGATGSRPSSRPPSIHIPDKEITQGDKDYFLTILKIVRGPIEELCTVCCDSLSKARTHICVCYDVECPQADASNAEIRKQEKMRNRAGWLLKYLKSLNVRRHRTSERISDIDVHEVSMRLSEAIRQFDERETEALQHIEGVDVGPREEILLVFFFMASMRDLARSILELFRRIETLQAKRGVGSIGSRQIEEGAGNKNSTMAYAKKRIFFPRWVYRKWMKNTHQEKRLDCDGPTAAEYEEDTTAFLQRVGVMQEPRPAEEIESISSPVESSLRQQIVAVGRFLSGVKVRFTIKSTVTVLALLSPAFTDSFMATFLNIHGYWAAIAFLLVISPSVGDTILSGLVRLIGSIFGVFWAVVLYYIGSGNPVVVMILGQILIVPSWYLIIVSPQWGRFALINLLSFTTVILMQYHQQSSVLEIAYQRICLFSIGILAGFIVNSLWWPFVARKHLRKLLGKHLLALGALYSSYIVCYIYDETRPRKAEVDTVTSKLLKDLARARALLTMSEREPRLKGPFPIKIYADIIQNCQDILDRFVSIRYLSENVQPLIPMDQMTFVNRYRHSLNSALTLNFHILGASLTAKAPLPPVIPSPRIARQRIHREIRLHEDPNQTTSLYRRLFWYSCSASFEEVIERLDTLREMVKLLVGECVLMTHLSYNEEKHAENQESLRISESNSRAEVMPISEEQRVLDYEILNSIMYEEMLAKLERAKQQQDEHHDDD
ncbi:uncharacterized protein VTP21DRAFT_3363 [Calcarisporiella thermophila]|uniref:uncharacterized protein n=1 Tax=Calcarisporiella thermophila TaxID=911321 RepID=UPI003743F10E